MHNLTPQQKQINAINAIIEDVEALAAAAQSIPHYLTGDNRVTTYQLAVLDIIQRIAGSALEVPHG